MCLNCCITHHHQLSKYFLTLAVKLSRFPSKWLRTLHSTSNLRRLCHEITLFKQDRFLNSAFNKLCILRVWSLLKISLEPPEEMRYFLGQWQYYILLSHLCVWACYGYVCIHLWGFKVETALSPLETMIAMNGEELALCVMEVGWPHLTLYSITFDKASRPSQM